MLISESSPLILFMKTFLYDGVLLAAVAVVAASSSDLVVSGKLPANSKDSGRALYTNSTGSLYPQLGASGVSVLFASSG